MEEKFFEYINQFESNDKIKHKKNHSIRVRDISAQLAHLLHLPLEEIALATTIGLLHDIGRFEQIATHNTTMDHLSIDHGNYGVTVLQKDDLVSQFTKNKEDIKTVYKAIQNHNKYEITNCEGRELLHAKLIRDADKIDILRDTLLDTFHFILDDTKVSKECHDEFLKHQMIHKTNIKSDNDYFLAHLAYIFDFNFIESYQYIEEIHFIDSLYKIVQNNSILLPYIENLATYIKQRRKNYVRNEI